MNGESYLLLFLGIIMVTISFSIHHYSIAQINSSDIQVGDDIIQPITPTSDLNNTQVNDGAINSMNNWTVVSGNWTMLDGSLHGGSPDNTVSLLNSIILNPEGLENITEVSSSVKVGNLNTTTANYATIVYSFIDGDNFKLAGINIYGGAVQAVGYTIDEGNQVAEPSWPCIQTDLKWTPGATYNLTLVDKGSSLGLIINGTEYLSLNNENDLINQGEVGLSYGRIQDISFLDFTTGTTDQQLISNNVQNNTNAESFTTSDTQTILLEGQSLPENGYIHLYDTTPYQIVSGHVAANLPYDEDTSTEVMVLAGQAPNLAPIELEYIPDLSSPDDRCLYHADINSSESNSISDIAIGNNSTDDIDFPDTSSVVISVSEISRIE